MKKYFIRTAENDFIIIIAEDYEVNNFGELFFINGMYSDGEQVVIIQDWLEIAVLSKSSLIG
jgi:hypothetical protein